MDKITVSVFVYNNANNLNKFLRIISTLIKVDNVGDCHFELNDFRFLIISSSFIEGYMQINIPIELYLKFTVKYLEIMEKEF